MRDEHLPLTETTYYLLLAFLQPTYGYLAIQNIEQLSAGAVRIAAGTMYGAIDNLLKAGMLQQLSSDNTRRKIYQTTPYGQKVLQAEVTRMTSCVKLYKNIWRDLGGGPDEK